MAPFKNREEVSTGHRQRMERNVIWSARGPHYSVAQSGDGFQMFKYHVFGTNRWVKIAQFSKPVQLHRALIAYRRATSGCKYCFEHQLVDMMPPHEASRGCQSGRRPHCTCDRCF